MVSIMATNCVLCCFMQDGMIHTGSARLFIAYEEVAGTSMRSCTDCRRVPLVRGWNVYMAVALFASENATTLRERRAHDCWNERCQLYCVVCKQIR